MGLNKVPFIVDIDLTKNQLQNAVIHKVSAAPSSPVEGQIYYNTSDNNLYIYVNVIPVGLAGAGAPGWMNALEYHKALTAYNPSLGGANVLATLSTNATGHVTAATTRVLTLADLGYTGATDANKYIHPSYTARDSGALTGVQVVSRVTSDTTGHITALTTRSITNADITGIIVNDALSSSATYTWSVDKIQSFIANAISGQMVYIGGYNATTNVPDLESGTGVKIGYTYTVTAAGDFFSAAGAVQVGDMLIAEINSPTTLADWTVVNKNIADIVPASETESGIIEIATQAEVDAGTDDTRAITPLKLKTRLDAFDISDTYSQTFGNGVLQTFTITHNLNSSDVHVVVREVASGMRVEVQWVVSSVNVITIGTNSVPLSNFYRVTVKK